MPYISNPPPPPPNFLLQPEQLQTQNRCQKLLSQEPVFVHNNAPYTSHTSHQPPTAKIVRTTSSRAPKKTPSPSPSLTSSQESTTPPTSPEDQSLSPFPQKKQLRHLKRFQLDQLQRAKRVELDALSLSITHPSNVRTPRGDDPVALIGLTRRVKYLAIALRGPLPAPTPEPIPRRTLRTKYVGPRPPTPPKQTKQQKKKVQRKGKGSVQGGRIQKKSKRVVAYEGGGIWREPDLAKDAFTMRPKGGMWSEMVQIKNDSRKY